MAADEALNDVDRVVGANVRRLRQAAGLDRATLARRCGVTTERLESAEDGAHLTAVELMVLARQLTCHPCDLFRSIGSLA